MSIFKTMAVGSARFYNANYFHREGYVAEGAR
jgi:hypothetical protein